MRLSFTRASVGGAEGIAVVSGKLAESGSPSCIVFLFEGVRLAAASDSGLLSALLFKDLVAALGGDPGAAVAPGASADVDVQVDPVTGCLRCIVVRHCHGLVVRCPSLSAFTDRQHPEVQVKELRAVFKITASTSALVRGFYVK